MSTRQLLIEDLSHQPDSLVQEVWHYMKFLELQQSKEAPVRPQAPAAAMPKTQQWPSASEEDPFGKAQIILSANGVPVVQCVAPPTSDMSLEALLKLEQATLGLEDLQRLGLAL